MVGGTVLANGAIRPEPNANGSTGGIYLMNTDQAGGVCLSMEKLCVFEIASGGNNPTVGWSAFVGVSPWKMQIITAITPRAGLSIRSASGSSRMSKAIFNGGTAQIKTTNVPGIFVAVQSSIANVTVAADGQGAGAVDLRGGFLVPPGFAFIFQIFSDLLNNGSYGFGLQWSELDADIE